MFGLRNLVSREVDLMNQKIVDEELKDQFPHPLRDPSDIHQKIVCMFVRWYFTLRRDEIRESSLISIQEQGMRLQEMLPQVYPDKSGESAGWGFYKFHVRLN